MVGEASNSLISKLETVERNDIEKALGKALESLEEAVTDSDKAHLKAREAATEADAALIKVEKACRLIQDIKYAIGKDDG